MKCLNCEKELSDSQKKFCCSTCKLQYYSMNKYHTTYSQAQDKRGKDRKIALIKELGGKCSICGYNKNLAALAFHHIKDKSFTLDSRTISRHSMKIIRDEVAKCILVCHNCHSEIHHPEFNDLL